MTFVFKSTILVCLFLLQSCSMLGKEICHCEVPENCQCKIREPCDVQNEAFPIFCTTEIDEREFVCGCDGVTYFSSCIARRQFCNAWWTQGACPGFNFSSVFGPGSRFTRFPTTAPTQVPTLSPINSPQQTCLADAEDCEERQMFNCCHDLHPVLGCDGITYSNRCFATQCGCNNRVQGDHVPTNMPIAEPTPSEAPFNCGEVPTYAPTAVPATNVPGTPRPTQVPVTNIPTVLPISDNFPTHSPTVTPAALPTALPTNLPTTPPTEVPMEYYYSNDTSTSDTSSG